jgi:hypothetical protein
MHGRMVMGAKRAPTTQTQVYRTVLRNTAAPARMNRFISRSGHQLVTSRESPTLDSSIYYWCSLEPYPAGSRAPSPSCAPCRGDGNDPGRHMAGPRVGDDSRAVVGRPRPSLHRRGWLRPHARPGQDRCWTRPVLSAVCPGAGARPVDPVHGALACADGGGQRSRREERVKRLGVPHVGVGPYRRRVGVGPHVTTGETMRATRVGTAPHSF